MERLNKVLAHAGVGSRRLCDQLILAGRVTIDGKVVRQLGTQVEPAQHRISVDGEPIHEERHVYWVVNKPRGFLCTNHDPARRPLVLDLVPQVDQRVYTVGRLDESSEGLVLLTNDGDLAFSLMHPRFGVEKTYQVQVAGHPAAEDLKRLQQGIWLSEGRVKAASVKRLKSQGDSAWLKIVLREGKNREIRRMLARFDHKVLTLKRIAIGPIGLGALKRGKARKLLLAEVQALRDVVERKKRDSGSETTERPHGVGAPVND